MAKATGAVERDQNPRGARSTVGESVRLRADARRNREQLLLAARDIFVERGPDAPLEEVAQRAGVGIGTLYRRFRDRQTLARAVALDVLARITQEAHAALAEEPDAFSALARYMHRALDLRVGAVMPALVGAIALDEALLRARDEAAEPVRALIAAAHADGTLRPDVEFGDIGLLVTRFSQPLPVSLPRTAADELAHRHLTLLLDGLRGGGAHPVTAPLPGPALSLGDLQSLTPSIGPAPDDAHNPTHGADA